MLGRLDEAPRGFVESLELAPELCSVSGVAEILHGLAEVAAAQADAPRAAALAASAGKSETAFFWRDQLFSFTFIGIYDPAVAGWGEKTKKWADRFRAAMEPNFSGGVYVNYMQSELPNWQEAYYGENLDQLRAIKAEVDPDHVFRFPQSLAQPAGG